MVCFKQTIEQQHWNFICSYDTYAKYNLKLIYRNKNYVKISKNTSPVAFLIKAFYP